MVPTSVANTILNAATRQLQMASQQFTGKNLVLSKFGEELTKQINSSTSQQHLTATVQTSARPITFLAGGAESLAGASPGNSTKKRKDKKRAGLGSSFSPAKSLAKKS